MLNQQTPDLRTFFTGKAFPGIEIIQSPFLAMEGKYYAVVGQRVVCSSPFITNYNVFDEMGNTVSNTTAEKVYEYVAMTHMSQSL